MLVKLYHYHSRAEAELARNFLATQHIKVILQDDPILGATAVVLGTEVYVDELDYQKAHDILGLK